MGGWGLTSKSDEQSWTYVNNLPPFCYLAEATARVSKNVFVSQSLGSLLSFKYSKIVKTILLSWEDIQHCVSTLPFVQWDFYFSSLQSPTPTQICSRGSPIIQNSVCVRTRTRACVYRVVKNILFYPIRVYQ